MAETGNSGEININNGNNKLRDSQNQESVTKSPSTEKENPPLIETEAETPTGSIDTAPKEDLQIDKDEKEVEKEYKDVEENVEVQTVAKQFYKRSSTIQTNYESESKTIEESSSQSKLGTNDKEEIGEENEEAIGEIEESGEETPKSIRGGSIEYADDESKYNFVQEEISSFTQEQGLEESLNQKERETSEDKESVIYAFAEEEDEDKSVDIEEDKKGKLSAEEDKGDEEPGTDEGTDHSEETAEIPGDDEDKSVESLSSVEKLIEAEKKEMVLQYDILIKLRNEHIQLKRKNLMLSNKLVQYFKKQKMDHVFVDIKEDPALEQQYMKQLMLFQETNQQMADEKLRINTEWETQRNINNALAEKVNKGWEELYAQKREVAGKLIDSKTGRAVPHDKAILDLLDRQEAQREVISECRLKQIKLKHHIEAKKMEQQMKHEGKDFNIMEYEKLASLNEYYMDKITDRDVEINEVNKKIAAMDEKLAEVKEQLRKKEEDMNEQQQCLYKMTQDLHQRRENLNILKSNRHKIEKNIAKIKQQSGLLAYPSLLKDYEQKTHLLQQLLEDTEALKQDHQAALAKIAELRRILRDKV